MPHARANLGLSALLLGAVFLWGASNAATKYLVGVWPPVWTGAVRFLCAGLLLLGLIRWCGWLGKPSGLPGDVRGRLWYRGGLSLALYIVVFYWAVRETSVSHVALYLGAAPVWALLWEGRYGGWRRACQRYGAALLALGGVLLLCWPALAGSGLHWRGEILGLAASVLWTFYGRQCRVLSRDMSAFEVSAHTMWRAGMLLLPIGLVEVARTGFTPTPWQLLLQGYCILGGSILAFSIWAVALRRWATSKVYLFNNLIPISTMSWAHFTLGESVSPTFWFAMAFIVAGVALGQANWFRIESPKTPDLD